MLKGSNILRIANAQAFWGDSSFAASTLMKQEPSIDYLTLDYLSEVTLSILAIQKEQDHEKGYARDFLEVIASLVPFWMKGSNVKIISNAGGLNPLQCALDCQKILRESNCQKKIAVVLGDDVFESLKADDANPLYNHLETHHSLKSVLNRLVTANAYLGAQPIVEAIQKNADIIITGRCADPSLTVAPCIAHFNWRKDAYDKIAAATVAGHLIECGTQVTGGISTHWLEVPDKVNMGFPIIEMNESGTFIVTKPKGSGGQVTIESVKEQLLYELGDPSKYLSPDATVSFLSLSLEEQAKDRIVVAGAKGRAPPPTYKVSGTYQEGYRTEGTLAIFGSEARKKAKLAGEILLKRLESHGLHFKRSLIECLGTGDIVPGVFKDNDQANECLLRIAVADDNKESIEYFSKELASLVTSGPQGTTGYISGRPHIRKCFGYWPCLILRENVTPKVQLLI